MDEMAAEKPDPKGKESEKSGMGLCWLIEKLIAPPVFAVRIVLYRNHEVVARTSWFLFVYFFK